MHIVRYAARDTRTVQVGIRADGAVAPLKDVDTVAELLTLTVAELRARVEDIAGQVKALGRPESEVLLLPPVDGLTEVWASGVTYERSREARLEESSRDIYGLVYEAERPELFMKCPGWRVVTDDESIGVRSDSRITVPEPELAAVVNQHQEIVGYTVCNDMSSRDIEGENPLYIPQAKTYPGSCALASGVRPAWEVPDAHLLGIEVAVRRDGKTVWTQRTSTTKLHRTVDDQVAWLFQPTDFPHGVILTTGTGVVPEMDFTLGEGDRVDIAIDEVGSLSNTVRTGKEAFGWVTESLADPFAREEARR